MAVAYRDLIHSFFSLDSQGLSDPYAELLVGKTRTRTAALCGTRHPNWDRDFNILVDDVFDQVLYKNNIYIYILHVCLTRYYI